jgi:UDP-2-acetamido-2-deoxy-ribo-hexuluronate aminotransferase
MIEFRDIGAQYRHYKDEIDNAISEVIRNASFIGGKPVYDLEKRLAQYIGVGHCISCANGTEAMTMVLMALGIGEGDAVFVPDFTFFSTGEVVSFRKATPVFVDVDELTFNIDPVHLEKQIQRVLSEGKLRPKMVIPVDLFGLPYNVSAVSEIASFYDLFVLEDAAQGFGGSINGQKACNFGDCSTTSFFPAKPLGCYGDGGAIFTDRDDLAGLLSSLKVHGKGKDKYNNERIGVNSRLDTLQAAILQVKLKAFIRHELDDVNRIAKLYTTELDSYVQTPYIPKETVSSYAQYTILLKDGDQRERVRKGLGERNIPSFVYYIKPMHRQGAFSELAYPDSDFPITVRLCERVLSLPMHPYLTEEEVRQISQAVISLVK